MIINTHKAITDYAEGYKQALEVHGQAVKYIKDNYKEGSEIYNSAMKTAQDTLYDAITPIKDSCVKKCKTDFEALRKAIQGIVTAPPTPELLGVLPLIREGKMNETETKMFVESFKGNYMDTKLLYDVVGKQFRTVDGIIEDIDRMEAEVDHYFATYQGESFDKISYKNGLILGGASMEMLEAETTDFINTYSVSEGGEE